jgi:ADP-heptose:LPS heptosyltransferase
MRNDLLNEAPQTIAVFRALQLGDMLCTVPALRAVRAAFPQARITLVGLPWAESFVRRFSSYLDDFVEFPGWPGLPEREARLERIPGFLQQMQERQFDLAIQMQGSGVISNPLVALFGAKQCAGFYTPGQFAPQEDLFLPYPQDGHEIRVFLQLAERLGASPQGEHLEFPIAHEERDAFERLRSQTAIEAGGYILLHPGARFTGRRWPPEKFAQVGDSLSRMGYQVLLTGSSEEKSLTEAVCQRMSQPAIDLGGKTDLGTLAVLMEGAHLLVSNDTGVSHMAAALRVPSVVLFSASDPNRWRPLDQQLHRAIHNSFQVSPDDVMAEVEALLQKEHRHARQSL